MKRTKKALSRVPKVVQCVIGGTLVTVISVLALGGNPAMQAGLIAFGWLTPVAVLLRGRRRARRMAARAAVALGILAALAWSRMAGQCHNQAVAGSGVLSLAAWPTGVAGVLLVGVGTMTIAMIVGCDWSDGGEGGSEDGDP